MDWVAIDRVDIGLFLVVKDSPTPERASSDDMTIRQDILPSLGIHDKASGFAGPRQIPVKRVGLRVAKRHDTVNDLLYCPAKVSASLPSVKVMVRTPPEQPPWCS